MIKTTVHITDSGMENFAKAARDLRGSVDIGVFGGQDSEQVVIAAANEFGTERAGRHHNVTIPQRSFLRSTADEEKDSVRGFVEKARVDVVTGQVEKKTFLARLGLWFVGKVQAKIAAGGEPFIENAPSTAADKVARGRDWPQPLNDLGRLRQSITHQVNE